MEALYKTEYEKSRINSLVNENIKRVIEEEMLNQGLTQEKLAEASGISQPTISRFLSHGKISLNNLRKVYRGLGLPFLLDIYDRKTLLIIKATLQTHTQPR